MNTFLKSSLLIASLVFVVGCSSAPKAEEQAPAPATTEAAKSDCCDGHHEKKDCCGGKHVDNADCKNGECPVEKKASKKKKDKSA